MTMPVFRTVNMPMGFVVLLPFSTSFSTPENAVMHPVIVFIPHLCEGLLWFPFSLVFAGSNKGGISSSGPEMILKRL